MARVLLFGALSDIAGWREQEVESASIAGLRAFLASQDQRLADALDGPGVQVAVDQVIVRGEVTLSSRSEVAFLPPMSGG